MSGNRTLFGIVLSNMPVGENDKRVVLLTKEHGRIACFARGSRRPGNSLSGSVEPFCSGEFEVYEGRDSYSIHSASIKNYFKDLKASLELVWYGYYFLEIAEYFSLEGNDERERMTLLYQSLRALESGKYSPRLVRAVYEFKTLCIGGNYPNVFECVGCGAKEGLKYISVKGGGCVCVNCRDKLGGRRINDSTLYALRFVASKPSAKLFSFTLSDEVLIEMESIIREYYRMYIGHTFKSESFLDL